MPGFAVRTLIVLIVIALIVLLIARAFRRAPVASTQPRRERMPLLVPLGGAVLLAAGFVLALASFTSRYTADLLPARVASVVVFAVGVCLIVAHRNWYVEFGADAVRFRTVSGREKRIAYGDVASARTSSVLGRERLVVRSRSGVKLALNPRRHEASALARLGG